MWSWLYLLRRVEVHHYSACRWKFAYYSYYLLLTCQHTLQVSNTSDVRWSLLPWATQHTVLCLREGLDQYTLKAAEQEQNLVHLVSKTTSTSRHFMKHFYDGTQFEWRMIITQRGAKLLKNIVQFCEWPLISTILKSATLCISTMTFRGEKSCSRNQILPICSKQRYFFFLISLNVLIIHNWEHTATFQYRRGKRNWEYKVERY